MSYANRTCYNCGMKKPVNYMEKKLVETSSGNTMDDVTFLTWVGFWWSNKASKRKLNRQFFANNKRVHRRKTPRWFCADDTCDYTIDGEWTGHTTENTKRVKSRSGGFLRNAMHCILAFIFFSPISMIVYGFFAWFALQVIVGVNSR